MVGASHPPPTTIEGMIKIALQARQSRVAGTVTMLFSIACLTACSADVYQSGPGPDSWTNAEREFVAKARELDPEYYAADAVASRWIVAGRATCEALREGLSPEESGKRVQGIVDMEGVEERKYGLLFVFNAASAFCPEYVEIAGNAFEAF